MSSMQNEACVKLLVLTPAVKSQSPAPLSQTGSGSSMAKKASGVAGEILGLRGRFTTFPTARGTTNEFLEKGKALLFSSAFLLCLLKGSLNNLSFMHFHGIPQRRFWMSACFCISTVSQSQGMI